MSELHVREGLAFIANWRLMTLQAEESFFHLQVVHENVSNPMPAIESRRHFHHLHGTRPVVTAYHAVSGIWAG